MKRRIAKLAPVLLLAATLAACDSAEERAEKHFQSALELVESGDTARAKVEFRNTFQLDPTHLEARRAFAQLLEEEGNWRGALQNFLVIAEQYPQDAQANAAIAKIAILTNQWEEAERYGRRAGETSTDDPDVKLIGLNLDYRQAVIDGDAATRKSLAEEAIAIAENNSKSPLLNRLIFDWYLLEGRDRDALKYIDRAIEEQPDEIALYQGRLAVLNNLGETPEIRKQLGEMVDRFPDVPSVRQTMFSWLMSQNDIEGAEAFLRETSAGKTGEDLDRDNTALIQFIRAQRGDDAALAEIDRILEGTENKAFYQALGAGIIFDLGKRDEAIATMESIVAGAEPSAQINNSKIVLARMLIATGNPVGARALIEETLVDDKTHVAAIKLKADFLISGDKATDAIVLLRVALDNSPRDPEIYSLLAKAYERNGDRALIGDQLARAAEVSNRGPVESIRLAKFLVNEQQLASAEQALIESLRRNNNHPALLSELGSVYLAMEKLPEAANVEDALRSVNTDAATSAANNLRLGILRRQNRSEDLIAMMETLSEDATDKSRATVAIMRTHLANGDFDKARATIDGALAEDPDNLNLKFAAAIFVGAEGDSEGARAQLRTILDEQPLAQNVWLGLARSYAGEGDLTSAESVVDEALISIPGSGNLKWAKAGYLERRGDIEGAIAIYEDLYDATSSSLIAANNLASLLSSYRPTPETIERAYTIARRLRGIPQPAFQDTYGWIAFLRGDLDQALGHLESAASGLPNDPLVQYHLARAYEELKQPAKAATAYETAIKVLGDREIEAMQDAQTRLAAVKAAAQ